MPSLVSDLVGLGWSPSMCLSTQFPGDADTAQGQLNHLKSLIFDCSI